MKRAVWIIVIGQLFGVSLWFSANAAAVDLERAWGMTAAQLGLLTNAVQIGFIAGTLGFALTGLADRFSASRIVFVCSVLGAASNAGFALFAGDLARAWAYRFAVGLSLAGIYPVGMKLIVSWVADKAGAALGLLIGMFTLGTALPHGLRALGAGLAWQHVVLASSLLALVGGIAVLAVGDGPHLRPAGRSSPGLGSVLGVFRLPRFRASALAYFGHMWELYAFWTVVPLLAARAMSGASDTAVSVLAFAIIAVGGIGCALGGRLSQHIGSARVAAIALTGSAAMCAVYPALGAAPHWLSIVALLLWGVAVSTDSPQFSALSAANCPPEKVGSALAIQNAIGFAISVAGISVATGSIAHIGANVAWLLLPGPLLGLLALRPLLRRVPIRGATPAASARSAAVQHVPRNLRLTPGERPDHQEGDER